MPCSRGADGGDRRGRRLTKGARQPDFLDDLQAAGELCGLAFAAYMFDRSEPARAGSARIFSKGRRNHTGSPKINNVLPGRHCWRADGQDPGETGAGQHGCHATARRIARPGLCLHGGASITARQALRARMSLGSQSSRFRRARNASKTPPPKAFRDWVADNTTALYCADRASVSNHARFPAESSAWRHV